MNDATQLPQVTLAGVNYDVKPLVWKQLRTVIPAFGRLRALSRTGMTAEAMDDLALVVFTAVAPVSPGLTYDAFTDLPISQNEMLTALPVIATQSGMKAAEDGGAAGEETRSPSTSTN